jgi:hypothetical protein
MANFVVLSSTENIATHVMAATIKMANMNRAGACIRTKMSFHLKSILECGSRSIIYPIDNAGVSQSPSFRRLAARACYP